MELKDFRKYLVIDKDALDECLVSQPDLYYQVSQRYAEAVADRDAAKLDRDKLAAELDGEYRASAAEAGEKLTEAALQNKIRLDKDMAKALSEYAQLGREVDEWGAMKEAFSQRSFMLRELVALHIAGLRDLTIERGTQQVRNDLADAHRRVAAGEPRGAEPPFARRRPRES